MTNLIVILIYLGCYLIGSINFSLIAGKWLLHKDIRKTGSGNAGTTNLARSGNKKIAICVLGADIFRAYVVLFVCAQLPFSYLWPFVAIPLLLGNLFPIFHGFQGGKGIAMSIGIFFAIHPLAGVAGIVTMGFLIAIWKKVSVGSLGFLVSATILLYFITSMQVGILATIITAIGVLSHRENIRRLINGSEPYFTNQSK